jgi:N-acyl-D-amino-acid deacylase
LYGKERFVEDLKFREFRDDVKRTIHSGRVKFVYMHPLTDPYWGECFQILRCKDTSAEGKTVQELSRERKQGPLEVVFDLLVEDPDTRWAYYIDKRTTPVALPVYLKHPLAMISTDTVLADPHEPPPTDPMAELPHPTLYGMYPHYIGTYSRDMGVLGLEEAIRKATFFPAQRLGIKDRGIIAEGAWADIVVFDYGKVRMRGDFLTPAQPPEGIEHVMVNGQVVYEGMLHTGARPGQVLRRP